MMTSNDSANARLTPAHNYVDAAYSDHENPEYHGNPLISALPFFLTDEDLMDGLENLPLFDDSQRMHSAATRLTYIGRLSRCVVALPRTTALARALLDLMLEGYVGREPFLPEHRLKNQRLYDAKKKGLLLSDLPDQTPPRRSRDVGAELSTAFIGASGTGKTTTMKQIANLLPAVIRHEDMWQVPTVIFELPPDGKTLHGLATSIIDALARRLPHCGYADLYLRNVTRRNALERIYDAASLVHLHGVGLLIADEAQKEKPTDAELKRKEKPSQSKHKQLTPEHETPLISLLITASNKLGVPLVLVGTTELHDVLQGRFARSRRAVGHGTEDWGFLKASGDVRNPDEFEMLLRTLWRFQWLTKPVKLSDARAALFFELTQGNPDIVVKLFASAQRKAIRDGVEELTEELIRETFRVEFRAVHQPLAAHAEQDPEKLVNYLDIAPVELRSGPTFTAVAAEMNQVNYERKRKVEAAVKRRTNDAEPLKLVEPSNARKNAGTLGDALVAEPSEGDSVHKRLMATGALASNHDAV